MPHEIHYCQHPTSPFRTWAGVSTAVLLLTEAGAVTHQVSAFVALSPLNWPLSAADLLDGVRYANLRWEAERLWSDSWLAKMISGRFGSLLGAS